MARDCIAVGFLRAGSFGQLLRRSSRTREISTPAAPRQNDRGAGRKFRYRKRAWPSSAELVEHPGVSLHQANEILGFEQPQRPAVGARFSKSIQLVRAAASRVQQNWLWMPRMAFHQAGG